MDRKEALILLSVVALIAIASIAVLTVYATANGEKGSNSFTGWFNRTRLGTCGQPGGWRWGEERYRFVEVSEEYKENATNIAKNDPDVLNLLSNGYNVTEVRPIITTKVDAEGNVLSKATNAIVMLQKDTTSRASVWVNLEEGKVTKIVILTMTVIEKP